MLQQPVSGLEHESIISIIQKKLLTLQCIPSYNSLKRGFLSNFDLKVKETKIFISFRQIDSQIDNLSLP
jgi:hypothetical protein